MLRFQRFPIRHVDPAGYIALQLKFRAREG
jgi:hypothetical protein